MSGLCIVTTPATVETKFVMMFPILDQVREKDSSVFKKKLLIFDKLDVPPALDDENLWTNFKTIILFRKGQVDSYVQTLQYL